MAGTPLLYRFVHVGVVLYLMSRALIIGIGIGFGGI